MYTFNSLNQRTINLVTPIFLQSIFQTLFGTVDTFMVSQISDHAVAAVGVANRPLEITCKLFYIVSMGIIIIIPQLLGDNKKKKANTIALYGVYLNAIIGLLSSVFFPLFSSKIVLLFGVEKKVFNEANIYLSIVGSALVFQALMIIFTSIMQSYEKANLALYVSLLANAVNLVLDYYFVFVLKLTDAHAVSGVAFATAISQFIAFVILLVIYLKTIHIKARAPFCYKDILIIIQTGGPAVGETLSYSLSQFVITLFITRLGTKVLAGYIYAMNIMLWVSRFPLSLGKASGIIVASLVGEKEHFVCLKYVRKNMYINLLSVLIIGSIPLLLSNKLLLIFTADIQTIQIGKAVIFLEFIASFGKSINFVMGDSIRGSGNPLIPMSVAVFSMWFFGVAGSYIMGILLPWGIYGIAIAFIIDEFFRAGILTKYWNSKKWVNANYLKL